MANDLWPEVYVGQVQRRGIETAWQEQSSTSGSLITPSIRYDGKPHPYASEYLHFPSGVFIISSATSISYLWK